MEDAREDPVFRKMMEQISNENNNHEKHRNMFLFTFVNRSLITCEICIYKYPKFQ